MESHFAGRKDPNKKLIIKLQPISIGCSFLLHDPLCRSGCLTRGIVASNRGGAFQMNNSVFHLVFPNADYFDYHTADFKIKLRAILWNCAKGSKNQAVEGIVILIRKGNPQRF